MHYWGSVDYAKVPSLSTIIMTRLIRGLSETFLYILSGYCNHHNVKHYRCYYNIIIYETKTFTWGRVWWARTRIVCDTRCLGWKPRQNKWALVIILIIIEGSAGKIRSTLVQCNIIVMLVMSHYALLYL